MEPETSSSRLNLEKPTIQQGANVERAPISSKPELDPKLNVERYEQLAETSAIRADVGLMTTIPTPVVSKPVADNVVSNLNDDAITSKEALIEKEWVDRAKKIVAETQNDPYKREEKVSILQKDYLKKHYGRELGVAE